MEKFFTGLMTPFTGVSIMRQYKILALLALVPMIIVFGFGFLGYGWLKSYLIDFISSLSFSQSIMESMTSTTGGILSWLLSALLSLILFVFSLYFSYVMLNVVGAPFYSFMSEKVLLNKGISLPQSGSLAQWLRMSGKMIGVGLLKALVFMFITVSLFVASFFIPFLVLVLPFLLSLMLSFDCMDYGFECRGWTFRQRTLFFQDHLAYFSGIALGILAFTVVPGLFIFSYPCFIVGATHYLSRACPHKPRPYEQL